MSQTADIIPLPKTGEAQHDDLLECLVFLTAFHGRAKSAEAIRAGLAYDEKGMGPELFCEAAERLQLKSKIVKRLDLFKIPDPVLPVVLVLKQGRACILLKNGKDGKKLEIYRLESGQRETISAEAFAKFYSGYAIYVHPSAEFKDPEAPHRLEMNRHWFWSAVLGCLPIYGQVAVAGSLIGLFGLTGSLYIMNVYDRVIPNNALETGWVLALGAVTIYVFDFIMRTLRAYFIDVAGRRIDVIVTRRIYDQLLNMKLSHRPSSSGAFASMLRDFESVKDFVTSATMTAVVELPFSLFYLFFVWLFGGIIAVALAGLILVVAAAGLVLQYPLKMIVRKTVFAGENKHGLLVETINALETIKAIGAEGRLRARYSAHVGESAAYGEKSRFISGLGVNFATFLQQNASILIVLIGMYLVRDGNMTMGALIASVILGGRAIAPIGQIANLMARYHSAMASLRTLDDIMARPVERPADKQFLHRPELKGKIAFDRVAFAYPGLERKVLDEVRFTINPGERVGIVGRIGSGKSTIARLIMGLYDPLSGTIFADDTDYRQIDPADLRRNIAYIAQDIVLFRGSIRENIAIGRPQASDAEILAAAKAAGVHDFVARHPLGYDAQVGERGEGLSGGQRQSIALARAMLLKPQLFVCDEPTNAMDMQAEQGFVQHIREQSAGRTFILITHRQHLLALVDRLILVDQGRIVADGPRDEVLSALSKGLDVARTQS
jgi:ATP-binding cassette subfamily C protein LapB